MLVLNNKVLLSLCRSTTILFEALYLSRSHPSWSVNIPCCDKDSYYP